MLENSFIKEIKLPNTKSVYELTQAPHSHLVCKKCSAVEDITIDLNSIVDTVTKLSSFKVDSTNLVLSGICKRCYNS